MSEKTTNQNDSTDFDGHTHYFYDSNGHMYIDISAVRERGHLEIVPIGGGEITIPFNELRMDKEHPILNLPVTTDGDDNLREAYTETSELVEALESLVAIERDRCLGYREGELHMDPKRAIRNALDALKQNGVNPDHVVWDEDREALGLE